MKWEKPTIETIPIEDIGINGSCYNRECGKKTGPHYYDGYCGGYDIPSS